MRTLAALFVLLLSFAATKIFAQGNSVGFSSIDWNVQAIKVAAPAILSKELTAPYSTDREKVRSIFKWITENIAYQAKPITNRKIRHTGFTPSDDDTVALKPLSERVAELVLSRREAYCDGYSRLFKTLCDYAGIRAEVVSGYANGNFGRPKFKTNHSWNAVYFDSAWHLLDATWAAGYFTYASNDFVKHYNDYYYLTNPRSFANDHYPEELKWTLLDKQPVLREFDNVPFKFGALVKYHITSFLPAKGVIEAAVGDTIKFQLDINHPAYNLYVTDSTFVDSALVENIISNPSECIKTPSHVKYYYVVPDRNVEWVHLIYYDHVIMRYRLNIKPPR
jgi:hypothetical protein